MGLFGGRKKKVVDWSERLRKQQEQSESLKYGAETYSSQENSSSTTEASPFPFFAGVGADNNSSSTSSSYQNNYSSTSPSYSQEDQESSDYKRRKLAKRLIDMTEKIEELSNQIYRLQQRVELLERKNKADY